MRDFRRLPPFLRVVGVVGLLFAFTSAVMLAAQVVIFIMGGVVSRQELANDPRLFTITLNLFMLSLACGFAVNNYRTRLRQPNRGRFTLDSWQRQARAIALLAALPLCAIALAAILPPTQDAAILTVFLISIIGASVQLGVYMWLLG